MGMSFRTSCWYFILAVAFWIFFYTTEAKLSLNYEHTWEPTDGYIIRWSIYGQNILNIALEVHTLGWIGFGIGEPGSGGMAGADIVTGFVNSSGGFIVDRWASFQGMTPEPDVCQDWTLVAYAEESGKTILELRRALVTQDVRQDRAIVDNNYPTLIVGAWGTTDKFQLHDSKFMRNINFFISPTKNLVDVIKSKEELQEITFAHKNYAVPGDKHTKYANVCFDLAYLREPLHIVAVYSKHTMQTKELMHHMILNGFQGHNCTGASEFLVSQHLDDIPHVFPSNAGIRIGGQGGLIQSIRLQTHFHNPKFLSGRIDNSGIIALTTHKLREHDIGTMELADSLTRLNHQKLLDGLSQYTFVCSSSCTKHMAGPITVFQSNQHMHLYGKTMLVEVARKGKKLGRIDATEYYDGKEQNFHAIKPFQIEPKDELRVRCVYETNGNVTFGVGAEKEMCTQRFYYYPKKNSYRPDGRCGIGFCGGSLRRPTRVRSLSRLRKWGKTENPENSCH